jgi:uncharacterized cupredoxin-like copper-binding protein
VKGIQRAVLALTVAIAVSAAGYAVDAAIAGPRDAAHGPGLVTVELGIEHSTFSDGRIEVRPGTFVRFVVRNEDPILHELVVGPPDVHARHARGAEQSHPPRPGEVTVQPNDVGITIYRFDEPGSIVYACHLPGHLAYGMRGTVVVAEA